MRTLNLENVHPDAAERVRPFLEEIAAEGGDLMKAMYVTGSAVTPDFNDRTSDVNTFLVLDEIPLRFLGFLAPLGRKYGKRRVGAPLLMTTRNIERSLDAFPVEFLDLKLVNHLVVGEDVLKDVQVSGNEMRLQCERELKGRILRSRQDYIRSLGDPRLFREALIASLAGLIPLLRGTLFALGKETPRDRAGIMAGLREATGCETDGFEAVIRLKADQGKPSIDELTRLFAQYHGAIQKLADVIDATT